MAWVRIDDQVPRNAKFLKAGPKASWLWVCGMCHAQSQLTDGIISEAALPFIGVLKEYRALARQLVDAGLWERVQGGYLVHDYHHYNATRAEMLERRKVNHRQHQLAGQASGRARTAAKRGDGNGR